MRYHSWLCSAPADVRLVEQLTLAGYHGSHCNEILGLSIRKTFELALQMP